MKKIFFSFLFLLVMGTVNAMNSSINPPVDTLDNPDRPEVFSKIESLTVQVYPNPVVDYLNVKLEGIPFDGNRIVEVYSLEMQQVLRFSINGEEEEFTIPVSMLSNGMYILKIDRTLKRFAIQK